MRWWQPQQRCCGAGRRSCDSWAFAWNQSRAGLSPCHPCSLSSAVTPHRGSQGTSASGRWHQGWHLGQAGAESFGKSSWQGEQVPSGAQEMAAASHGDKVWCPGRCTPQLGQHRRKGDFCAWFPFSEHPERRERAGILIASSGRAGLALGCAWPAPLLLHRGDGVSLPVTALPSCLQRIRNSPGAQTPAGAAKGECPGRQEGEGG